MDRGPLRNCMGYIVLKQQKLPITPSQSSVSTLECNLIRFADRAIKIIQSAYRVLNNLENKTIQNNKT